MLRSVVNAIRTGVGLLVVALYTLVAATWALVVAAVRPKSRQITWAMRSWGWLFTKAAGVKVKVEGGEHVAKDTSYVVVSNHLSNIDPPLHIAYLPMSVRFLAKKELFRIPLFGQAMRAIGIIETDREAHASAHRSINAGVARVMELERSLIVYPEGHRSRDGELHTFKKGAFRIAVDNALPILPAALTGTWEAWPPGAKTLRGGRAKIVLHPPIETTGMTAADLDVLRDRVYATIAATLEREAAQPS